MKKEKIAFQGEYGANSHIACQSTYPLMEPLPCASFMQAIEAVQTGKAKFGMIPIENTLAGRVADIHRLLPHTKLFIIGEYFLPIHFALLVLKNAQKEDITTVHSHVHALDQCRNVIKKNNWQPIIAYDTAGAAKILQEKQDKSIAVLAPALAADIYNLKILQENVEDETYNITRFIVLSRDRYIPPLGQTETKIITTLLFRTRNVPSALYKALGGFATNGVNLTKLESYQLGDSFCATQFLVDVEGHIEEPRVQNAMEELRFFSEECQILGVYPAKGLRKYE